MPHCIRFAVGLLLVWADYRGQWATRQGCLSRPPRLLSAAGSVAGACALAARIGGGFVPMQWAQRAQRSSSGEHTRTLASHPSD